MRMISTRGQAAPASISDAIRQGQASDRGLFLPETPPRDGLAGASAEDSLAQTAERFLAPLFEDDPLAEAMPRICAETFDFDVPLVTPDPARPGLKALELIHGPTGAFKDFGARFLMRCLDRMGDPDAPFTVLAATSGDTGGAVGAAAEGRRGVRATILFPKGRVSAFQRHQLTCWNAPVRALELESDFDACQALVKDAFADAALRTRHRLTSANSINLARLLPQGAYLAWAARRVFEDTGRAPGFAIPTGNLGHGVAALLARMAGAPIGPIVLATNANATLADWARTGAFEPRASIATLANAMDVGAPSNFERLAALPAEHSAVRVERVDDAAIRARIKADFAASGYVWCPHSATAAEAYARLPDAERSERSWIVAATAHPYKFADAVEPLIGEPIAPTPALAAVLDRASRAEACAPTLADLSRRLDRQTEIA